VSNLRETIGKARWLWSHSSILTVLLVGSVALNVLLALKVRELSDLSRLLQLKMNSPVLVPGSIAPAFSAKETNDKKIFLNYAESELPTVIYLFSPDCHWCDRNLNNIRALTETTHNRFRFVGVSLRNEDLQTYLAQAKLSFQIYHSPPDEVRVTYGLNSTPSTIVVSPAGKILQYWRGAYTEELQTEIEQFFQVKLPGLIQE
jgi:peroxiredoxin